MSKKTFIIHNFRLLAFAFTILFASSSYAQSKIDGVLEKASVREIDSYEFSESFQGQILLKMPFGKTFFSNSHDTKLVGKVNVKKVELVYTYFPTDDKYQDGKQRRLNAERLKTLMGVLPDLFDDESVKWELVVQTSCQSSADAKEMFHGFVIHYEGIKKKDADDSKASKKN